MRKNEKLIKSLFLFKFKDIRKRLESVRALSNKRLPNGKKKSKIEILQNAQICCERGDMEENPVRRLSCSLP